MLTDFLSFLKRLPLTTVIIGSILLIIGAMVLRRCDRKKVQEVTSHELKPGEQEAVILDGDSITVVEAQNGLENGRRVRNGVLRGRESQPTIPPKQTTTRIDGARGVRISVDKSGTVFVTARTRGFCFEPGLGVYTTASDRRLFVDVQLLFARRHGVNAGLGLRLERPHNGSAFIAYSYNFWSNSSVLVGYDTNKEVLLGVRVKI